MTPIGNKYTKEDFEYVLNMLRSINPRIGSYCDAKILTPYTYSVTLSNGKLIIPVKILEERFNRLKIATSLKITAQSFSGSGPSNVHMNDRTIPQFKNTQQIQGEVDLSQSKKLRQNPLKGKFVLITALSVIILTISVVLFYTLRTGYGKGISLLKEGRYELAKAEFQKVKQQDDNYHLALSKIKYCEGMSSYNRKEYVESYYYLKGVSPKDEFFSQASSVLLNLEANPAVIYDVGMKLLENNSYSEAAREFTKISNDNEYFKRAQNKLNYIRASELISAGQFEQAEYYVQNIGVEDEYFDKAKILLSRIVNYKDRMHNRDYAMTLIKLSNETQDIWDISKGKSFLDIREVYTSQMIMKKSEISSTFNKANEKDTELNALKELILKLLNNYLMRLQNLSYYGKQTNYNNNEINDIYGEEIRQNREAGDKLYNKLTKEISRIKKNYDL